MNSTSSKVYFDLPRYSENTKASTSYLHFHFTFYNADKSWQQGLWRIRTNVIDTQQKDALFACVSVIYKKNPIGFK